MAKDPAFLFYPNDWIGGTMGMTFEEKGAYMELLMLQFNRGHMTSHMIGHTVGQLWVKIKDKFIQDDDGLWYNPRLEIEKEKRRTFTLSRRNNKKGVNQHNLKSGHMTSHMTSHMTYHMENENSIVESNTNTVTTEFSLQHCKEIALRDESWVSKNKITPQAIDRFIEAMLKDGDYVKTPKDFKKHCRRWLDIQKQEPTTRKLNIL